MGRGLSAAQKAQIASYKFSRVQPWRTYGAARVQRGSSISLENFGPSWRGASAAQRDNRKVTGFTGRGGYLGSRMGGLLGRSAAKYVGASQRGQLFGEQMGSAIGDYGHDLIMGRGAYKLQGSGHETNALISSSNPLSMMSQHDTGAVIVTRSEYVKDIVPTTTQFQNQFIAPINPGIADSFEWISQIAQFYEQYEFIQLFYEFKSTVTPGNSTAAGTVMITPLQTESVPYTDKTSMSFAQGFVTGSVSKHLLAGVECHPSKVYGGSVKRVRTGDISDPSLINYDLGQIQVSTAGCTGGQSVGELWCHFTVKLSQPRLGPTLIVGQHPISADLFDKYAIHHLLISGDGDEFGTGGSVIASQTVTNIFGLSKIIATVQDTGLVLENSLLVTGLLANAGSYQFKKTTADASFSNFSANATMLKFSDGSHSNRRLKCTLTVPFKNVNAAIAANSVLCDGVGLYVGVFGNIQLIADENGDYVIHKNPLTGFTSSAATTISLTDASVCLDYSFYVDIGDVESDATGVILQLSGQSGNKISIEPSLTLPNRLEMIELSHETSVSF